VPVAVSLTILVCPSRCPGSRSASSSGRLVVSRSPSIPSLTCSAGIAKAATCSLKAVATEGGATRLASRVHTYPLPSAHPATTSPLPRALTAHTVVGCVIDCTIEPSAAQMRTVRSSEHVMYSPDGSTETWYTNDSDAWKTERLAPPSSHSRTVPSFEAERKPTPETHARARTTSVCPVYVCAHASPFHSLIVRSPDAVSVWPSSSSSGSTAHSAVSCPLSTRTHSPSFHTRAVLSHDAE